MIRQKIRRFVATLAVAVVPVFVAVPLDDCEGQLDIVFQTPDPATPVIPLPPPGNYDDPYDAIPIHLP